MEEIPTIKPTRLNLDRVSMDRLNAILSTGSLDTLSEAERQYFYLMDMVRGLTAKMKFEKQNKYVTKAGIIKLLKSEQYGLSDWMARQVYTDAINFSTSVAKYQPKPSATSMPKNAKHGPKRCMPAVT